MLKGSWFPIVCFKHDGSVHRSWNKTLVIYEDDKILVLGNDDAMVFESDGRNWKVREPAITIFFKNKWYNVIAMIKDDGIKYYVNIASPYTLVDNNICYIDYDLDVSLKPSNPLRILDEHEYYSHYEEMRYGKEIDYLIKNGLYEVLNFALKHTFPFEDDKIAKLYNEFLKLKGDKNGI